MRTCLGMRRSNAPDERGCLYTSRISESWVLQEEVSVDQVHVVQVRLVFSILLQPDDYVQAVQQASVSDRQPMVGNIRSVAPD